MIAAVCLLLAVFLPWNAAWPLLHLRHRGTANVLREEWPLMLTFGVLAAMFAAAPWWPR